MDLREVKKKSRSSKVYTMTEVAKFMEISYPTLYRMVRDGKIKVVNRARSGKRPIYGFTGDDVQAYYDSLPNSAHRPKRIDE